MALSESSAEAVAELYVEDILSSETLGSKVSDDDKAKMKTNIKKLVNYIFNQLKTDSDITGVTSIGTGYLGTPVNSTQNNTVHIQ